MTIKEFAQFYYHKGLIEFKESNRLEFSAFGIAVVQDCDGNLFEQEIYVPYGSARAKFGKVSFKYSR